MIREELDRIIKMNNEVYVLGRLATDREYYPNIVIRQESVCQMKNSESIAFFIEALSEEPEYCKNILNKENLDREIQDLYIGIDRHHLSMPVMPFYDKKIYNDPYDYNTIMDKEDIIYNELNGKLLIFKINLQSISAENKGYKNLILQSVLDIDDDGKSYYKTVPEIQESINLFEDKLLEGKIIYLKGYTHDMPLPEAIICGEYIYTCKSCYFEKVDDTIDGWKFVGNIDEIKKLNLDIREQEYDIKVIRKLDSIVFVEEEYFYDNLCAENKESICINKNVLSSSPNSEINFLKKLKNYTMSKNLYYDMKDIINLHTSIKTNYMTIVAGMSGTGKTQISLAYAKSLGLTQEEGTLLFLPITPSYTEPEDITGYLNTTTGLYIASETGLIDFLIHAQNNPDKLHFVIFDEMNLSQVEYWFAPFISLLELDKKDRKLQLYSKECICHNNIKYKSSIDIGDNVRFIGTVNLDETTKDFSDRLLDRANLVSLRKGLLKDFKKEKREFNQNIIENTEFTLQDFESWVKKDITIDELLDDEIDLLDEIHTLISSKDPQKGVSFRIANKISSYLQNIPIDQDGKYVLNRDEALDIQIKQRVLTKIRGTERQFGSLIGNIDLESDEIINSSLYEILNSQIAANIGEFKLTKDEIKKKARELTIYGYTN